MDYAPESEQPLVGRFLPSVFREVAAEYMSDGRFLLLDLVGDGSIDAAVDGADRVRLVHRPVPDPDAAALLVRPDGYVAWAGADTTGLRDALDRWYAV
ncbi:aromatic-ring hydroxylase C-terminal domain-containing protein [Streptomyces acidicola]|uniref:Monooxygenase n=1 Tax=Streptomyces acidicola TaxID=2596892 RepID=A0A5N8X431_9ACTN|nr:hypothetical protein [Streptomyces acidicola]MPY53816.1 hypothetical protein [Streptomyces acidicola]